MENETEMNASTEIDLSRVHTDKGETKLSTKGIILEILKVASSTILYNIIVIFQENVCVSLVSHRYGDINKIESIGLVSSILNFILNPLIVGLVGGFASLGSSAYSSKNNKLLSIYMLRTLVVGFAVVTAMYILAAISGPFLISRLTTNTLVQDYTYKYLMVVFGFGYADVVCMVSIIYLNIIDKIFVGNMIALSGILIFPFLAYFFINMMGFIGCAMAILVGNLLVSFAFGLYIFVVKPDETVELTFSTECFKGMGSYIKYCAPVVLLICCMNWGFELQSLFALHLGDFEFSIYSLIQNVGAYLYIFCESYSESSVILVGKLVAKGELKNAKKVMNISLIFGNVVFFVFMVLCSVGAHPIMRSLTKKPELLKECATLLPIFCFLCFPFFTLFNLVDTLRALNKQATALLFYALNAYFLQVMLSWLFTTQLHFHLRGIFLSMFIGFTVGAIIFKIYIDSLNFKQIHLQVLKKIQADKQEIQRMELDILDEEESESFKSE